MKSIVGKILDDRYRIVRQLSSHGWRTIYLAEDLADERRRQRHVEQIQPYYEQEILGRQSWQKVCQEFLVRGNLLQKASQHPQVPQLLAFFECDREFYLVREIVEGTTLEQKLKEALLSESEAIAWLQSLLRILEFVHKSGVAHLNLQPASAIELTDGSKWLTDFAPLKNLSPVPNSDSPTAFHADFASLQDRPGLELSADIYALGKTIIYALTGELTNSIQSKSLSEVKSQQLTNLNNSPSADIRPELARILNKMVAEPENYRSVTEVLKELDFQSQVVTFPPPFINSTNFPQRSKAKVRNRRQTKGTGSSKSSKVIWFWLSLPFILASAILFFAVSRNSEEKFAEYVNDDYQFSLKYPQNWSKQQIDDPITGEIVVFNSPPETNTDLFSEKVYIAIEYLSSEPTDLNEYSRTVVERIQQTEGSDRELYEEFSSTIDNASARTVIYARQQSGMQLRQMESFTIKNNQVYIAIYTAEADKFAKFYPTVEKMLGSWKID